MCLWFSAHQGILGKCWWWCQKWSPAWQTGERSDKNWWTWNKSCLSLPPPPTSVAVPLPCDILNFSCDAWITHLFGGLSPVLLLRGLPGRGQKARVHDDPVFITLSQAPEAIENIWGLIRKEMLRHVIKVGSGTSLSFSVQGCFHLQQRSGNQKSTCPPAHPSSWETLNKPVLMPALRGLGVVSGGFLSRITLNWCASLVRERWGVPFSVCVGNEGLEKWGNSPRHCSLEEVEAAFELGTWLPLNADVTWEKEINRRILILAAHSPYWIP